MPIEFKGEEKVMYLLRDTPTPVLDCLVERIHHEKKRRQLGLLPPLRILYLRNDMVQPLIAELKAVGATWQWLELEYGVKIVMFYATQESEQLYPECSVLFFAIDQTKGKGYGL